MTYCWDVCKLIADNRLKHKIWNSRAWTLQRPVKDGGQGSLSLAGRGAYGSSRALTDAVKRKATTMQLVVGLCIRHIDIRYGMDVAAPAR